MRKQLLVSVSIALLLLVGCKAPTTFGGIARSKVYRSIISLSPSTTELIGLTGVPIRGRTNACNYPPNVGHVPVVADLKPNYEQITSIKPDLILLDRDLYGESEIQKLKATGSEIKIFGSDTVEGYIKEMYILGNLVSGESNINDYVVKVRKNVQASQGEAPPRAVTAVLVIPDSTGHHMIAGTKSFQADVVRIIGAKLLGPDSNKFESLNPEFLISQSPDYIIVAGDTKTFIADPRFSNLSAVKNLKIFGLNQDVALRRGSRVDQFIYEGHKLLMLGEEKK
jgi:ABC-type Fe3+-hydroxamate transport system substrate-binding protein